MYIQSQKQSQEQNQPFKKAQRNGMLLMLCSLVTKVLLRSFLSDIFHSIEGESIEYRSSTCQYLLCLSVLQKETGATILL